MYFISGFISFLLGLFMLFSLQLFSIAFPNNVIDGEGNGEASAYFQSSVLFYPILFIILGLLLTFVHFRTKK
ncbi:hypothetical protein ACH95_04160 [Bacillus glycinifermentans]|uniref:Uncharacterized protein n=1 Tax=Bacillus glycinifermentans TaxID=1664069 RepID=A0A0J6EYB5_9BACI|nr:hypothetical protein COP00_03435 [Bacillus glycinifermentans]KMM62843.1 hypothetical protein ACH95_04160 [Bacillus glycinifermentans]KRT95467.1 hypothetical protein AB447_209755 [Bacillus glycinifermentans]